MKVKDHNTLEKVFVRWSKLILTFILISCSSDENEIKPGLVNLQVVEGKYTGALTTQFGAQNISMIMTETGNNNYDVDFFETLNFSPAFTKDGQTPDGRGSIVVEEGVASIDIAIGTELSPCEGTLAGPGTWNNEGTFSFEVDIDTDCGEEVVNAVIEISKTEN